LLEQEPARHHSQVMILPILYSLFNIGTVVCIVVVNKTVFQVAGFQFPTLLVGIHCGITHIGLRVAALLGAFERRKFPKRALIVLALSFIGYNVASLANLALNTVGFYQISKIMATPTTMALESVWLGKKFPRDMRYAVGVMCVGVGLATVTDVQATWIGGLIAIVAAMGAAQSYIFIGKTQHDLGASSNQLLVAYTPYCFVFLMLLSPLDTLLPKKNPNIADNAMIWIMERMTFTKSLLVIFSGCIGLLVSLSTFLLIKETSPLTYNIVGHAKTICILVSGVVFFEDKITSKKFIGIVVALSGMIWYGQIKLRLRKESEKGKKKQDVEQPVMLDNLNLEASCANEKIS